MEKFEALQKIEELIDNNQYELAFQLLKSQNISLEDYTDFFLNEIYTKLEEIDQLSIFRKGTLLWLKTLIKTKYDI